MAKKQYYCIDFKSFHTAIHGLICYDTRRDAEKYYKQLETLLKDAKVQEFNSDEECMAYNFMLEHTVQSIIDKCSLYLDEVDFHEYRKGGVRNRIEKFYYYGDTRCIIVNWFDIVLY